MSFVVLTANNFPNRGSIQAFGGGGSSIGGDGLPNHEEPLDGEVSGGQMVLPVDLLMKRHRWHLSTAPGTGNEINTRFRVGPNRSNDLGATMSIADTAVDVANDLEITLPGDGSFHCLESWTTLWTMTPASSEGIFCSEYAYVADPKVSVYCAGADFGGVTFSGSDSYFPFHFVAGGGSTEAANKTPFPITATFKRIRVKWKLATSTTLQLALRKNGADTGMVFSLVGSTGVWQTTLDTTTAVSVTAGDLLAWRMKTTTGSATTADLLIGLGCSA